MSDRERLWSRVAVHQILINEKYSGHNVWGRTSFKLKTRHVRNDPAEWIRCDQAFPAIVSQELFDRAPFIIEQRAKRLSDEEMPALLSDLLAKNGSPSGLITDAFAAGTHTT